MPSQEPYALGEQVLQTSLVAIRLRYSLINFFYTKMFEASLHGGMIFKAALFNYPTDANLHDKHSSDNFLLGDELLVHPVLA
jgi:alpha-glucosidase (family GH31 glycosyl hydrolase)